VLTITSLCIKSGVCFIIIGLWRQIAKRSLARAGSLQLTGMHMRRRCALLLVHAGVERELRLGATHFTISQPRRDLAVALASSLAHLAQQDPVLFFSAVVLNTANTTFSKLHHTPRPPLFASKRKTANLTSFSLSSTNEAERRKMLPCDVQITAE
jgi:hypothetical protein